MFFQTIIIFGVMLVLLTIISTLGGSMNRREKFIEGDDDAEGAGMSGEIVRRSGAEDDQRGSDSGVSGGSSGSDTAPAWGSDSADPGDMGPSGGDDYASSAEAGDGSGSGSGDSSEGVVVPETKGLPVSDEGSGDSSASGDGPVLEAFDGDMWAAY
jgi:hypothetical protein